MNRTRRAILCLLAAAPIGFAGVAHADDSPGGARVRDDDPVQPAPWRWACTHPQAWVTGVVFVEGGRDCLPEDVITVRIPTDDPTQATVATPVG